MMPTQKALLTSGPVTADHKRARRTTELFRAMFNKAELSEEENQYLNENPDFPAGLLDLVKRCSVTNRYADEETPSRVGYFGGYSKPKLLAQQVKALWDLFPVLHGTYFGPTETTMPIPAGAEGLFIIPRWQFMAQTYIEAVQAVLRKLYETRQERFVIHFNKIYSQELRETMWKADAMEQIVESQKGYDLLVVPAQFGVAHRGRSARRARTVIGKRGFGLGIFEVGIMLLTHPGRLQDEDHLGIDCSGDECLPPDLGTFDYVPHFSYWRNLLQLGAGWNYTSTGRHGSASAVFPQE